MNRILFNLSRLRLSLKYRLSHFDTEEERLQAYFSFLLGYDVDLKNPRTFNEKLSWMKLYDHNPLYHTLVDKYDVKAYVAELIGQEYVVPCYGVWNSFDDIDFSTLPDQFVIKSTHYGAPIVVKDKSTFDIERAREVVLQQSKESGYINNYEWVYKDVPARVIIDKFLNDHTDNKVLQDYKFWCFNGEPKYMYLTVKDDDIYENFYDMDFTPVDINHGFARRKPEFKRPEKFEEMKQLATKLSKGIPFVRVDFFFVDGQIYFGEYTFYDWGGTHPFANYNQDLMIGNLLNLPKK
ncbi:MAG: glycosyl transferase [Alistipes sp.]|nr:glycosyl transferase [Alistipes sp.]